MRLWPDQTRQWLLPLILLLYRLVPCCCMRRTWQTHPYLAAKLHLELFDHMDFQRTTRSHGQCSQLYHYRGQLLPAMEVFTLKYLGLSEASS
ncbi:hypothetical protein CORC01_00696 [Colletotrichum orchidophilum]|uniref:Secreted protein n=1 Tax=Colletotrichum orchidophilum TaxID=1209926 RepID=A0A1G4BQV9_9PEZI|nr:uncharacterized protein CORC01_00696 [Colletotrichum orchidophilum]OHF03834.1 hypothetical protein CORC01_00696 [Colletotrichum orchidophilum]